MQKSRSNQINLRVSPEVAADLDALARESHATRIDIARQILLDGIRHRKLEQALQLYRAGKVSKSRAAEMADISLWELMDALEREAIPDSYTLQAAMEDVRRIAATVVQPAVRG